MGVVVRRYIGFLIILLISTPLVLALLCSSIPIYIFVHFKKNGFSFFIYRRRHSYFDEN